MKIPSDLLGAASEYEELKEAFHAQARQSAILAAYVTSRDTREEELKKAFHAQARPSAVIAAHVTPRDTREEASCHHPRKSERQPLSPKPSHTFFISAFAVAVLVLGFGGGYLLLADALTEPNEGSEVAEVTARGPPTIGPAQPPAPTSATEQEEPPGKLADVSIAPVPSKATGAAERGDVAGDAENGPAPSLPRPDVEVAKVPGDTRAAIDQSDVKTRTDELAKSATVEPPGQNQGQDMLGNDTAAAE